MKNTTVLFLILGLFLSTASPAQKRGKPDATDQTMHHGASINKESSKLPVLADIEPQPLLAQAVRLQQALAFLGSSLAEEDRKQIEALQLKPLIRRLANPFSKSLTHIVSPW